MRRALAAAAAAAMAVGGVLVAGPASAAEPGDSQRFATWAGYQVGVAPIEALPGDFDEDGAPDVAWIRDENFDSASALSVTRNFGEGTLDDRVQFETTEDSSDGAVADLDGDGHLDIVVIARGAAFDNTVIDLFLGDGDGGFTRTAATGGTAPSQVVAADLDGDGDPDLATTNSGGDQTVSVLLNGGDATFAPETRYPVGEFANGLVATDSDGDGDLDLVAAAQSEAFDAFLLEVLVNAGDGTFAVETQEADSQLTQIVLAAGDLDSDGDEDLVAAGIGGAFVLLRNDGTGTYTDTVIGSFATSFDLEAADLDGDGDLDVTSVGTGNQSSGAVTILRNGGTATFTEETLLTSYNPVGVGVADINRDGDPDLAVANRGSGLGVVHPGSGPDGFREPEQQALSSSPFKLVEVDVDLDGDLDIATTVFSGFVSDAAVQILLNDGTGTLDPGAAVLAGGIPESVDSADFDADGNPDLVWTLPGGQFDEVGVALGNGDGNFAPSQTIDVDDCFPGQVTASDLDGDGDAEIVLADESGGGFGTDCVNGQTVSVLPSNGDGTFGARIAVPVLPGPRQSVGADVDGDGRLDLVTAHFENDAGALSVALNQGGLDFAPFAAIPGGTTHRELATADLNVDGDVDVATVDQDDTVSVYENDGSGTAYELTVYPGEDIGNLLTGVAVAIGDLSADGTLDVAVANRSGNDVAVYSGRGDGSFDPRPIHYGLNADPADLAVGDFDGDGLADLAVPNTSGAVGATEQPADDGVSIALSRGATGPTCTVTGTPGADVLRGTAGPDVLCGLGGDDTLLGGSGDDLLLGGPGADGLVGGPGVDTLRGGDGADRVAGGGGDDVAFGEAGGDRVRGDDGRDELSGGTGNDGLDGGSGADRCAGGPGTDRGRSCEVDPGIP